MNGRRHAPVLATDLDGTLAHGTAAARDALLAALRSSGDVRLIYVTGRSPAAVRSLNARTPLPEPEVLIADVGTSVLRGLGPDRVEEVEAELDRRWPGGEPVRERLAGMDALVEQDVVAPRRVSYWIEPVRRRGARASGSPRGSAASARGPAVAPGASGDPSADPYEARSPEDPTLGAESEALARDAAAEAVDRLGELGVDVVVSANVFLDVLPRGVDKGSTLRRVLAWLGAADEACVVAGDSLNDLALFETGLRGIAVGNCEPALRRRVAELDSVYQATGEGVTGILEGLRYHGVVSSDGEPGEPREPGEAPEPRERVGAREAGASDAEGGAEDGK